MISHIDHVVLTVRDIDESVEFFARVLQVEIITFAEGRKALKFGNQKINLQYLGQERRNHAAVGSGDLCLIADRPLARVIEHLKAQSIEILEGPVEKSGAQGPMQSVYFNDPSGNLIEISDYGPAAGARP
ncbi:MAG: VOC family protein [Gammaproteobacteria bacterium]|nr:VOC family protein [Gammaproteobacteria bacterium]